MSNPKVYTPADVQTALKERLVKFEAQLKDLHARELRKDQHMEPGVHEAGQAGAAEHIEPGGHENAEMPMPQSPPEQPVGSSHGIPQGQLQDLCPMCGQPDMPGQCTCLNGGGNEGLMPGGPVPDLGGIDPQPTQPGTGVTPLAAPPGAQGLALAEEQMEMEEPMEMKEWEKPWEKKCSVHDALKCSECSMKKAADFIDKNGKTKMVGNHPDAVLPDDKKPKKIKGPDDAKVKNGLSKVALGMTKLPDGSGAATGMVGKKPLGKAAIKPNQLTPVPADKIKKIPAQHAFGNGEVGSSTSWKGGKSHTADHPNRDRSSSDPIEKVAVPMAKPPSGGSGIAPKPPAMAKPVVPKIGAPGAAPKMGKSEAKQKLSKSMGVCLFCGNGEHPGMCGLAKNIQTSLAKVASPILQPQPKIKAAASRLGHVATSPELGGIGGGAKTLVNPPQAGTVAGSPGRAARPIMPPLDFSALLAPSVPRSTQAIATTSPGLDSRGRPPGHVARTIRPGDKK